LSKLGVADEDILHVPCRAPWKPTDSAKNGETEQFDALIALGADSR
jgi:hypothetical protein